MQQNATGPETDGAVRKHFPGQTESETMRKAMVGSILLLFVGLASGLAILSAGVTGSNVDWLSTGFVVIISAGFVTMGGLGIARPGVGSLYHRLPALTLVVLGISSIIGGLVSFYPFRSTVNQGLQLFLMAVLVLTGIVLVIGGRRWARAREMRYPLGILTGGLVPGLAYITHQSFGIIDSPSMSLLVVLVAIFMAVAIAYVSPSLA